MGYIQEIRALVGHRPLILASAIVMIFDHNGHLLLQHRTDDNTWDFPGGFSEIGETLEETARREVLEEMGLQVEDMTLLKFFPVSNMLISAPMVTRFFQSGLCISPGQSMETFRSTERKALRRAISRWTICRSPCFHRFAN